MKKIVLDGLEGKTLEFAQSHNAIVDELEQKTATISDLKNQVADLESKNFGQYKAEIDTLKGIVADLEEKAGKPKGIEAPKTLVQAVVEEIKGLGVNTMEELKSFLAKNGNKTFEIKTISAIASTANSDTVGRTNLDMTVSWTPVRKPAFLGRFRTVAEQSNKSTFGYTEGTYTGAAAYAAEGTGNGNSDSATAEAMTGKYAKIQSVLSVNTEVYEDIPDFAQGLVNQMQIAAQKFVDDEAYAGTGTLSDNKIRGLATYATAAEYTAGKNLYPYAASVKTANVKDLVDAIKSYIDNLDGNYLADLCYMNPVDFYKMSKLKDTTGQPLFTYNAMGTPMLGGLEVVTSHKITADTMLILDSQVPEWRTKRSMTLQMGQLLANDALNDKQSAILSARYQLLVRKADLNAVIKVTSISAGVTAITAS